ncbi:MAG: hypothetical protein CMB45_05290 [Euryarchaeota archaeon]|nr:hypothetical protein [Euryarchaeota archaeon]MBK38387.1 hypothetical protein [Euryarchaeota archaeon]|tara:strand:- start:3872 stop:5986 length:2115 start_codon:yes stop_codon:yes gene_type:complete
MRLQIPRSLNGASILKAHNWVKGNIARTNPGGSVDYRLQDLSGNQISLTDVVSNPRIGEIEIVTTTEDVLRNPSNGAIPAMIQEPDPIYNYHRTGNDPSILLPGDIDPNLVSRLVAQEGAFSAVQTLTILLYSKPEFTTMDPKIAAMTQAYSNAAVRKNPSVRTPFTVSKKERNSLYTTERAIQEYLEGRYGVTAERSDNLIEGARIPAKYGLSKRDIEKFVRDVLGPFLVTASANRGALRVMNEAFSEELTKVDPEGYAALMGVLPTKAEQFYRGLASGLVAHPRFIYPHLGDKSLSKKQLKKVLKFAKKYPDMGVRTPKFPSTKKASLPYRILNKVPIVRMFTGVMPLEHVRAILEKDSTWIKQDLTKALQFDPQKSLRKDPAFALAINIGGFFPSPPPKWPSAVVYSLMDTILANLPHILDIENPGNNYLGSLTAAVMTPINKTPQDTDTIVFGRNNDLTLRFETIQTALDDIRSNRNTDDTDAIKAAYPDLDYDNPANRIVSSQTILTDVIQKLPSKIEINANYGKSVIELLYEISDLAQSKYGYTMSEDDHTFALMMLDLSLQILDTETPSGFFDATTTAASVEKELRKMFGSRDRDKTRRLIRQMNRHRGGIGNVNYQVYTNLLFIKTVQEMAPEVLAEMRTQGAAERQTTATEAVTAMEEMRTQAISVIGATSPLMTKVNEILNDGIRQVKDAGGIS